MSEQSPNNEQSVNQFSEQENIRREKLLHLKSIGIEPYPAALYPVTHYSAATKKLWNESPN